MLEWRFGDIRVRLSLLFPALIATLLLLQPNSLALTCLLASLIHEGGHLLAMAVLGVRPEECLIGAFGVRIRLSRNLTSYGKNLWISLAGPLANGIAFCVLMCLEHSDSGVVHLILAIFNLLPAATLDGGEILRCVLSMMGLETLVPAVLRFISVLILLPLASVSFWLFLQRSGNFTLLIVSIYLAALVIFSEKYEKTS